MSDDLMDMVLKAIDILLSLKEEDSYSGQLETN